MAKGFCLFYMCVLGGAEGPHCARAGTAIDPWFATTRTDDKGRSWPTFNTGSRSNAVACSSSWDGDETVLQRVVDHVVTGCCVERHRINEANSG